MSKRKVLSINYPSPSDIDEYEQFSSDRSLLDIDVIIVSLVLSEDEYNASDTFEGRPYLDEEEASILLSQAEHWHQEFDAALEHGKTIFVQLEPPQELAVEVRQPSRPGDAISPVIASMLAAGGREQTDIYNSHKVLPVRIGNVVRKRGETISPASDLGIFTSYWKDFSQYSFFSAYLDSVGDGKPLLKTKTGEKIVGALYKHKQGHLVLLPSIDWQGHGLYKYDEGQKRHNWTKEATIVANRFITTLIEIDKQLRAGKTGTPPPPWVQDKTFRLAAENKAEESINTFQERIANLEEELMGARAGLEELQKPKRLLYEKGTQLEEALVDALLTLGFKADNYRSGDSEFDVVFESEEGRCLGEAEGKDDKAVSVDKLRQLEMNIQEDFNREDVSDYAKPVLFGNGFRLKPPGERAAEFTEKCLTGAKRSRAALVRTSDLYSVVAYLKEHDDPAYAKACREAIFLAEGEIVRFPAVPTHIRSEEARGTDE